MPSPIRRNGPETRRMILRQILAGASTKQIPVTLTLPIRVVNFHVGKIYRLLGVLDRNELFTKLATFTLQADGTIHVRAKKTVCLKERNTE